MIIEDVNLTLLVFEGFFGLWCFNNISVISWGSESGWVTLNAQVWAQTSSLGKMMQSCK
jgi:hypothetical protein